MSTSTTLVEELDLAHRQILDALVEGDTTTLERLVADDCQIIGPKGFQIGKQEWIETHSSHVYTQVLLEVMDSEVSRHGDTAIRTDIQRSECLYQGQTINGLFRVLNVWSRNEGHWQLIAIQYTAVAPEAQL